MAWYQKSSPKTWSSEMDEMYYFTYLVYFSTLENGSRFYGVYLREGEGKGKFTGDYVYVPKETQ